MAQKKTESLGKASREIRHESHQSLAWYSLHDHQLGTHEDKRGRGLGHPKFVDAGHHHCRVDLHMHGGEEVMITSLTTTKLLQC